MKPSLSSSLVRLFRSLVACLVLSFILDAIPLYAQTGLFVNAELRCNGTKEYIMVNWYSSFGPYPQKFSLEWNWQGGSPGPFLIPPWSSQTMFVDSSPLVDTFFVYHVEQLTDTGNTVWKDSNGFRLTGAECDQAENLMEPTLDPPVNSDASEVQFAREENVRRENAINRLVPSTGR